MKRVLRFAAAGLVILYAPNVTSAQGIKSPAADSDMASANSSNVSAIPPLPGGKSTILGGAIRNVDPVLDRFTLDIVGEKPMRILFDERTQVFLDGKKIPLRDLRPAEHASVQTILDGVSVFAMSVHILSRLQQGDYRGEVLGYDPTTGDLEVSSGNGGDQVRLRVTSETTFTRKGQGTFTSAPTGPADLQRGALISIQFEPDGKGHASATEITFLATPAAQFIFSGNVIALDVHAGTLMLLDPRNNSSYQIGFTPGSFPALQSIHSGQRVRIAAEYDGTRYLARDVTPY